MKNIGTTRDLVIISITALAVGVLAYIFKPIERLAAWSVKYNNLAEIDELLIVPIFLGFALAIFAWRRWQELRCEIIERQRAEETLRESQVRFEGVVSTAFDAIVSINEDQQIILFNQGAERIFGWTAGEAIGQSLDMLLPPELIKQHTQWVREYGRATTETARLMNKHREIKGRRRDGSLFPLEVSISKTSIQGKNIYTAILHDITRRKEAEEALRVAEARYRALIEQTPAVVYLDQADESSSAIYISPQIESLVGYSPSDFAQNPRLWHELVHPEDYSRAVTTIGATLTQGRAMAEYRLIARDGRVIWVRDTSVLIHNETGQSGFIQGFIEDITERKQAEEERNRLIAILEATPDFVATADVEGNVLYYNRAARKILGLGEDEPIAGIHIPDTHPEWATEIIQNQVFPALFKEGVWSGETAILSHTGQEVPVSQVALAHKTPAGKIEFLSTIMRDITPLKQAEAALRESEARFRSLVENLPDVVYSFSDKRGGVYYSPRIEAVLGYTAEYLDAHPFLWNESIHPDDLPRVYQAIAEFGQGMDFDLEYRIKDRHGSWHWLRDRSIHRRILDGETIIDGLASDITERKQAELEIQRRNRELTLLNQIIASSASVQEPGTILETACRELALAFDVPQTSAFLLNEQRTTTEVVAEYLAKGEPALLHQAIPIEGNSLLTHKAPLFAADAQSDPHLASIRELIHQRGIASLLLLPLVIEDNVAGSLCLATFESRSFSAGEISLAWNVTNQVAAALTRLRLDQTHRRLITAIERTADSVVITDATGAILYVNPAFEHVTGYSAAEVLGQNPQFLKSGQHDAAFYKIMWATLTTGQVWRGRFINKKKDGNLFTEDATITPIYDENKALINYVAVKRDITRELQLEAQYRQAQKLESVGRLAGGIAHDFNNILTAIMGHTGLALQTMLPDHPAYSDIQDIQKSAERAANLTRQLLAYARRQLVQPDILNLNDLMFKVDSLLRRLLSVDIELITLPAPDLGQVKADSSQLEQVLLNLVVNARDAMPEGGKLILQTANITFDQNYAHQHAQVIPGNYVMLSVSDTGTGMTAEVKAHIFEPFFTTKEVGQGTGLGLATCFGIVKQNGGHIWVYSEPGQGSTFKIYLPRIEEFAHSLPGQLTPAAPPLGIETILLVEDEPVLLELTAETLRRLGYTVVEAANGEEALRAIQEGQTVHLLLTDVVMPRLGGKVLADRLKVLHPGMKILFMSGYTDETMVHYSTLPPGAAFLQKPFTMTILARKVREVLDT